MYGSIGSPLKAKTEKWVIENDYIEENKNLIEQTAENYWSKNSRLQSLRKRSSLKDRYNHLKYDHKIITTNDNKQSNLFIHEIEKSAINLPLVKPDGRSLCNENKVDSSIRLEKI